MIITIEEAREWCRIDFDESDTVIETLIGAAEEYIYAGTGNTFDRTNKTAKLLCFVIVADFYESRQLTNFRVGEKVRFIVDSMIEQLSHAYGKDGERIGLQSD